jgi:hypothetical protein
MKIQFSFYIDYIIPMIVRDMLLVSSLHPSFSCQDIAPIFAVPIPIVPKKKKKK